MVIKDGDVLEKYLEVDTFLFDKTGTITTSYPLVEKVLPFGDYTEKDIFKNKCMFGGTYLSSYCQCNC